MSFVLKSQEYQTFKYLQHWQCEDDLSRLRSSFSEVSPFFSYLLEKTERLYAQLPQRKDSHPPLIHPLNVILALRDAGISDEITLSVGLLHDYVEEKVDLYLNEHHLEEDRDAELLDQHEKVVFKELGQDLLQRADGNKVKVIIDALQLLTRHKRDFYYRSISNIFNCGDERVKEIAIRVKLADRMHNILSVACFNEEARHYQCFKNLFIINNTKKYLLENSGRISTTKNFPPTQLLFKRCAKATYDAYLTLCQLAMAKDIQSTKSMIQLAFKKFALEKAGVWEVTAIDAKETHLMSLYQGIVRKYDARLHHEWKKFELMKDQEYNYCRKFFADFKFDKEQIKAIIDYKDAYALKEVVSYLLYLPDYVIHKFLSSELNDDARIYS